MHRSFFAIAVFILMIGCSEGENGNPSIKRNSLFGIDGLSNSDLSHILNVVDIDMLTEKFYERRIEDFIYQPFSESAGKYKNFFAGDMWDFSQGTVISEEDYINRYSENRIDKLASYKFEFGNATGIHMNENGNEKTLLVSIVITSSNVPLKHNLRIGDNIQRFIDVFGGGNAESGAYLFGRTSEPGITLKVSYVDDIVKEIEYVVR